MANDLQKKVEQLLERIEALENQGFAQKLLIDELENQVERLQNQIKNFNPYTIFPYNPPDDEILSNEPVDVIITTTTSSTLPIGTQGSCPTGVDIYGKNK